MMRMSQEGKMENKKASEKKAILLADYIAKPTRNQKSRP